ncbi:MAG TPA: acyl-CoA dehydrogenase family protein [Candidatus Binatia bacterium]|nr:acyl-CoA dehydrogenase family protein [Candidatus Binatia bacterium]
MSVQPLPFFDQDHAALRERARKWVKENVFPERGGDRTVEGQALQRARDLGVDGVLQYTVPREFGGARDVVQARDLCILREELARGDALTDTMFAMQALGSQPIALAGSEAQKRHYLPAVARGSAIAAFAITEPEAGSDVAAMQTRALRQGDDFSITGAKCFISNAGIADFYVVFASTEPEKKSRSVSAFVVPRDARGLEIKEKTALLSPHPIGAIEFENCFVTKDALLGQLGEGLRIAFATLDLLRCSVGAAAAGLAQRALDEAVAYSKARHQFGRAIAEFQGIEFKLAEMKTELEAARLLVYQAAWAHDCAGADAKARSSMAKLYATEAAQRIVDQALQIHGASGLVAGSIMERLYRDVRALRIYEGTSEIQKVIIARDLLKKA